MDDINGLSQDFALGMDEVLAQAQVENETRQSAYDVALAVITDAQDQRQ